MCCWTPRGLRLLADIKGHTYTHYHTVKAHGPTVGMRAPCPPDVLSEAASGTNLCDGEGTRALLFHTEREGSAANLLKDASLCTCRPLLLMQGSTSQLQVSLNVENSHLRKFAESIRLRYFDAQDNRAAEAGVHHLQSVNNKTIAWYNLRYHWLTQKPIKVK